jgi:Fe-S cluster assembly iron-binding protein IscA
MMKEQITKRKMFAKPMSKASKNSGIMAGFEDMEPEEDEMPPMARNPQNPEILMNNLRGDFRSVDARYAELAQMVGEEAAAETPPEVLAMLQPQLAAPATPPQPPAPPPGGIGALPQGADMAPPPEMMGSMAPPQMPPGMEGAPPFPQGGADNAPPTPDGMPPVYAAFGGEMLGRGLRYGADFLTSIPGRASEAVRGIPGDVRNIMTSADEYFSKFLPPTFVDEPMKGVDNKQIYLQGKEVIKRNPDGTFVMGEGTRITPGTSMSVGREPVSKYFRDTFAQNPRMSKAAGVAGVGALGGAGVYEQITNRASSRPPLDPNYVSMVDQIPLPDRVSPTPPGTLDRITEDKIRSEAAENFTPIPVRGPETAPEKKTAPVDENKSLKDFIDKQLLRPTKSRAERIRDEYNAVEPTFRELLGDTKNDMRTNALLLLADAGFKFATERKATPAMALASALSGMPKGFAALISQARDMNIKIKSAALEQAANSITQQDKLANDVQIAVLKGENKRKEILLQSDMDIRKLQYTDLAPVYTDGGVGLTVVKNKRGDDLGSFIKVDPQTNQLPAEIQSMVDNPNTLRPVSPYVEDRGTPRTSMVRDSTSRIKLRDEVLNYDDALNTIDNMTSLYLNSANKFGLKGWYSDVKNNLFVPIAPVEPNIADQKAITAINSARNQLQARLAKLGGYGTQVAVKELEMLDKILPDRAGTLFSDVEVNLANLNSLKTQMLNERQQRLVRLGVSNKDYVLTPPAMGTKNDPFVLSTDPEQNTAMETFLRSSIGQSHPTAVIHLRMPNGQVQTTTAGALRGQ